MAKTKVTKKAPSDDLPKKGERVAWKLGNAKSWSTGVVVYRIGANTPLREVPEHKAIKTSIGSRSRVKRESCVVEDERGSRRIIAGRYLQPAA